MNRVTPHRIHDIALLYRITHGRRMPDAVVDELRDCGDTHFPDAGDLMGVAYLVIEDSIRNGIGVVCRG